MDISPTLTVSRVRLENFRNYRSIELSLSDRFNVLSGRNGQGKTNLLESLYLLGTARLLRGQRDLEAIREGSDSFSVQAELSPSETLIALTLERGGRKKAWLNGVGLPRASDLMGRLPCVSVSSIDMEIVRGEPAGRRLFIDIELSALYPAYLRHLSLYKRALEQRNALLKESRERHQSPELFEPWELQIAEHGSAMRVSRRAYIDRLGPSTSSLHSQLGSGEQVSLKYQPKDESANSEDLLRTLENTRHLDVARGSTQVGPHRDDLSVDVQDREARLYGSQGQQRTAVIALKLATLEVAKQELGLPPLLLLDDIFSDLDEHRRSLLVEVVLDNAGQVVLTCTEPSAAGPTILQRAKVFTVDGGEISEV
ncbi:DNA replication/repair protein RecF [soil metagenome]